MIFTLLATLAIASGALAQSAPGSVCLQGDGPRKEDCEELLVKLKGVNSIGGREKNVCHGSCCIAWSREAYTLPTEADRTHIYPIDRSTADIAATMQRARGCWSNGMSTSYTTWPEGSTCISTSGVCMDPQWFLDQDKPNPDEAPATTNAATHAPPGFYPTPTAIVSATYRR